MLLEKPLFSSYDADAHDAYPLFLWENVSQVNFNQSNFFFISSCNNLSAFSTSTYLYENKNFFSNFANLSISCFPSENTLFEISENFFQEENIFEIYLNLRKHSFTTFFISNMIDVPICFKSSKSLKTRNFELFFLKFSNLLMRKGKKEKTFRIILNSFFYFFNDLQKKKILIKDVFLNWFDAYFITNLKTHHLITNFKVDPVYEDSFLLSFAHSFIEDQKNFNIELFVKNFLQSRLLQFNPIFTYFIYNVDKNIRKYTRGKSGKYVFVWKYIAPYKRRYLMFKWFLQEIKFDDSRKFQDRLVNLFTKLSFNLKNTYAWRAKNYTYAFIFKNFRKTFMMSLKTVAKQ